GWFRATIFLPAIIPAAVFALAWLWILNPVYGPMNLVLSAVGLGAPGWFVDPSWAKPAIVLMSLWQIGEVLSSLSLAYKICQSISKIRRRLTAPAHGRSFGRFSCALLTQSSDSWLFETLSLHSKTPLRPSC
ncbi:MAG: hypothetical protein WA996_19785, partial [Candidatus Promineifilaceae bacterium]